MQHVTMKATMTEVDQEWGTFTAVVSAFAEDRQADLIRPDAYDETIKAWQSSGRQIPLLFEHSTTAIGSLDPDSMKVNGEGLVMSGEVDRSVKEGRQAWRQIKANTASFSIGFMSHSQPRSDGKEGREIYSIDLLEVSFTSTPVHPSARVLDWKSISDDCPVDLIGTAWDPQIATGEPVETLRKGWAEHERQKKAATPIQIASFPC